MGIRITRINGAVCVKHGWDVYVMFYDNDDDVALVVSLIGT